MHGMDRETINRMKMTPALTLYQYDVEFINRLTCRLWKSASTTSGADCEAINDIRLIVGLRPLSVNDEPEQSKRVRDE